MYKVLYIILLSTYFIKYLFCNIIEPYEFSKRELLKIYEDFNETYLDSDNNILDAENVFHNLKLLSVCNIQKKNFVTFISKFLCKNIFFTSYIKIKNVDILYGDFVHSSLSKYLKEINFMCKYYIYDNSYEIIKCENSTYRLENYFIGFDIEKRNDIEQRESSYKHFLKSNNLLSKNVSTSEKGKGVLLHQGNENRNNENGNANSNNYSNDGNNSSNDTNGKHTNYGNNVDKITRNNYVCKLNMNVSSYLSYGESVILKILIGLCIRLGYKRQILFSENIFSLGKLFEKNSSGSSSIFNLGFDVSSSRFYNSSEKYSIRSDNSFINRNRKDLIKTGIPRINLKFFANKSYLLWRGIELKKENFNYKLLELKNLLDQTNYRERIKSCYLNELFTYYEQDEIYIKKKFGNKIKYRNFRSKNMNKLGDSFLIVIFEYFCDKNVLSFEECVSNIKSSTLLDEKAKSVLHHFLYENFVCIERCTIKEEQLHIFSNDIIIEELQEYVNKSNSFTFKHKSYSKKIKDKIKKNTENRGIFLPHDDNIQKDFFENTMFTFEFESTNSILKDELDKININDNLENRICNISKYIKYHEKLYERDYRKKSNRTLNEYNIWNNLFLEHSNRKNISDFKKYEYVEGGKNSIEFSLTDIQHKISNFGTSQHSSCCNDNNDYKKENCYEKLDYHQRENYYKNSYVHESYSEKEYNNTSNELEEYEIMDEINLLTKKYPNHLDTLFRNNKNKNKGIYPYLFIMHKGEKEINNLQNLYEYNTLRSVYESYHMSGGTNAKKDYNPNKNEIMRKEFFNFIYYTNNNYSFTVKNVPTKYKNILLLEEEKEEEDDEEIKIKPFINNGTEQNSNNSLLRKRNLKFLCTKDSIWPYSKKPIKFSSSSGVYCEAQFENVLSVRVLEEEQTFEYLLRHITSKKKNKNTLRNSEQGIYYYYTEDASINGERQQRNSDTFIYPEGLLYEAKGISLDENSSVKSQIIGFHFFNNACIIKYIGLGKKYHINNPILSNVLLKLVFGYCIMHGFTTLKVEAETLDYETGMKTTILEILLNGKTKYEQLGLKLTNVAIFSKELYYIITGFTSKNDLTLSGIVKFEHNLYVNHNIENFFFHYINREAKNMLYKLTFSCSEDYYPYKNCYDIYPLVRKNNDNYCYFEMNNIFKELNELFPDVCTIGSRIGKCYEQIKKYILCSNNSEGCKYYNFIIDTFIKPRRKTSFFINHNMNVQEYLTRKSYTYYLILSELIKNGESGLLEKKNYDYMTHAQAYFFLAHILKNSTFFIFWNFSTEFWKRFQYIQKNEDGNAFTDSKTQTIFCPMAYAYEFIYHFNTFYRNA
ncbi:hypothetical protein PMALA_029580 [Plasmodium malariae]|uniref:Uncharacterized protein n=1 Tax=Plasmodium malariae TaxID=5858 RepID=A0A1A8WF12_PLAMA|nr:hypothetical protein PMALA_029580 [Plasmodium malariae]